MRVGNDAWARSVRETRRVGAPAALIPLSHPLNALRFHICPVIASRDSWPVHFYNTRYENGG